MIICYESHIVHPRPCDYEVFTFPGVWDASKQNVLPVIASHNSLNNSKRDGKLLSSRTRSVASAEFLSFCSVLCSQQSAQPQLWLPWERCPSSKSGTSLSLIRCCLCARVFVCFCFQLKRRTSHESPPRLVFRRCVRHGSERRRGGTL